jgi:hypothetical protein
VIVQKFFDERYQQHIESLLMGVVFGFLLTFYFYYLVIEALYQKFKNEANASGQKHSAGMNIA